MVIYDELRNFVNDQIIANEIKTVCLQYYQIINILFLYCLILQINKEYTVVIWNINTNYWQLFINQISNNNMKNKKTQKLFVGSCISQMKLIFLTQQRLVLNVVDMLHGSYWKHCCAYIIDDNQKDCIWVEITGFCTE